MANALYDKGREKFLTGAINASADTLKCALLKNTYSPTLASDEFFSALSAHVVGTPQTLASKTVTERQAEAADPGKSKRKPSRQIRIDAVRAAIDWMATSCQAVPEKSGGAEKPADERVVSASPASRKRRRLIRRTLLPRRSRSAPCRPVS